jgi:DMSO reductase anchor subunit
MNYLLRLLLGGDSLLLALLRLAQSSQHLLTILLKLSHGLTPRVATPLILSTFALALPQLQRRQMPKFMQVKIEEITCFTASS